MKELADRATAYGIKLQTLYSYGRPNGPVPNIADMLIISRCSGVPISEWLGGEPLLTDAEREYLAKIRTFEQVRGMLDLISLQRFKIKGAPTVSITLPSTRANFRIHKLSLEPRSGFQPLPLIRDLAAGFGVDSGFEVINNAYVEGAPKNATVATVRGDSMVNTLNNGDFILLTNFNGNEGYKLPRIENESLKMSYDAWCERTQIKDDQIVVVDLGIGEGPTLKRVKYDLSRGKKNWKLQIVADNPSAWRGGLGYQIEVGDEPIFYARMIALCEKVS